MSMMYGKNALPKGVFLSFRRRRVIDYCALIHKLDMLGVPRYF